MAEKEKTSINQETKASDELSMEKAKVVPNKKRAMKAGMLLNKRYKVEKELGRGGMGEVFKVLDIEENQKMKAVKRMFGEDEIDRKRFERTHPVGEKKSNIWGLYDMIGNVWEWCKDSASWNNRVMTDTYIDGAVDPVNKGGIKRLIRGAYWGAPAHLCRAAVRHCLSPNNKRSNIGLRLVKDI